MYEVLLFGKYDFIQVLYLVEFTPKLISRGTFALYGEPNRSRFGVFGHSATAQQVISYWVQSREAQG